MRYLKVTCVALIIFYFSFISSSRQVSIQNSTIDFPYNNAYINTKKPIITGRILDNNKIVVTGETVEILINGEKIGSTESDKDGIYKFYTENDMADGQYSIEVFCLGSNVKIGPNNIVIDTTLPPITILSPQEGENINNNSVTISGITEENAMVVVFLDNDTYGDTCYADQTGNWSVDYTIDNGPHVIKAQATDIAGNIGPISNERNFQVNM